jgi:hypothetical protein
LERRKEVRKMFFDEWIKFLRYELVPIQFPRDMFISRIKVRNLAEYLWLLSKYYWNTDCYVALYSDYQIKNNLFDTIFIDIDGRDKQEALEKLVRIQTPLGRQGISYRVYFSGRKGFHVYIDFPPTELKHPSYTMTQFLKQFKSIKGECVGDVRRLVRVPYTVNQGTGLFMYQVNPEVNLKECISPPPSYPRQINYQLPEILKKIDENCPPDYYAPWKVAELDVPVPLCIVEMIHTLKSTGELAHQGRLHISSFLLRSGISRSEIRQLFEMYAKDYKYKVTEYQLKKIEEGKLKCFGCRKLAILGLCPLGKMEQKKCPYYPSVEVIFDGRA